jgi:hypothetical protein
MTYDFNQQLTQGEQGEAVLDAFFSRFYDVAAVSMDWQRLGIDRIFTCKATGRRWSVEYKTDWKTAGTHNVFIETVSVDVAGKPGWVFASCAQLLVYYIPQWNKFYVWNLLDLRGMVNRLAKKYDTKDIANNGYTTQGIPVPLGELEAKALYARVMRQVA